LRWQLWQRGAGGRPARPVARSARPARGPGRQPYQHWHGAQLMLLPPRRPWSAFRVEPRVSFLLLCQSAACQAECAEPVCVHASQNHSAHPCARACLVSLLWSADLWKHLVEVCDRKVACSLWARCSSACTWRQCWVPATTTTSAAATCTALWRASTLPCSHSLRESDRQLQTPAPGACQHT